MCGIAGIIDLSGRRPVPAGVLRRMADAIYHRGPDDDGYLEKPGVGLANRRLSIVGLADGKQPIFNEDRSVAAVFNGEFFDYPEVKRMLETRGHRFATHCDTELIPHLWEDYQEKMFAASARSICPGLLRRETQPLDPGPRSLRHLPVILDSATHRGWRMAFICLRNQGPARLGDGAGAHRLARHRSSVQFLRGARRADLLRRRQHLAARKLFDDPACGQWHARGDPQAALLGNGFSRARPGARQHRPGSHGGWPGQGFICRGRTAFAGRCAGGFVPERRHRLQHRGRHGRQAPRPADPDVHHPDHDASPGRGESGGRRLAAYRGHAGCRASGRRRGARHLSRAYPRRRGSGHRHFLHGAVDAGPRRSSAWLQGRVDRRRLRRMAGGLSVEQNPSPAVHVRCHSGNPL